NGGDEETGLCRPRLVATQRECARRNLQWKGEFEYFDYTGAAPELRPPARPPRPWEAFHSVPIRGTQPGSKRPSNNTPLRPGRGLGAPSPQRVRTIQPDAPGASVPALHAPGLLPPSTDWQDCTPP